jgi:polysaccharide biosynthesis protein VpsM
MWRTKLAVFVVVAFFLVPHLAYAAGLYSLQADTSASEIQNKSFQEEVPNTDQPVGSTKGSTSKEVYGIRGGYVHPFLSVAEYFTDNVFYTRTNKESDFATILTPGIWLSVPHVYEKLLNIDSSNISPGGFSLSKSTQETFKRYQLYLLYNADFVRFSKFSSDNAVSHRAQGLFQYNLKSGLSLELIDQFVLSHDMRGTGINTELDKFRNNLANLTLSYDISSRLKIRADYSNFLVDYTARRNDFRDRSDNAVSGYLYYRIRPKTSLFVEYELVDIAYRTSETLNSKEHHWFGGIQWNITAKSTGSVKAGYGVKDFTDPALKSAADFVMEAQIDYQFTPKTNIILNATRRTNETNVAETDFVLSDSVSLQYLQKLTGKITGDVKLSYTHDDYRGKITLSGVTGKLKDNYYMGTIALRYKFKEWLQTDLGYIFQKRDSSFPDFNYITNVIFLRLTGTL